jgi:hypothetical protein
VLVVVGWVEVEDDSALYRRMYLALIPLCLSVQRTNKKSRGEPRIRRGVERSAFYSIVTMTDPL